MYRYIHTHSSMAGGFLFQQSGDDDTKSFTLLAWVETTNIIKYGHLYRNMYA